GFAISSTVASSLPPGESERQFPAWGRCRERSRFPVAASHWCAQPSCPQEKSVLPSGANVRQWTSAGWRSRATPSRAMAPAGSGAALPSGGGAAVESEVAVARARQTAQGSQHLLGHMALPSVNDKPLSGRRGSALVRGQGEGQAAAIAEVGQVHELLSRVDVV